MLADTQQQYVTDRPLTACEVIAKASELISENFARGKSFVDASASKQFFQMKLAHHKQEVFAVAFLDNKNRLIQFKEMFFGTINSATVYPREIAREALANNAAALIISHNHPSGCTEPSHADRVVTTKIISALKLFDIPVLDHIVVGNDAFSFAESGLIEVC